MGQIFLDFNRVSHMVLHWNLLIAIGKMGVRREFRKNAKELNEDNIIMQQSCLKGIIRLEGGTVDS